MTPLVWANIPLMLLFLLAWAGIPLWMVLRRPDRAPDHARAHAYLRARAEHQRKAEPASPVTAEVAVMAAAATPATTRPGRWYPTAPVGRVPGSRRPATNRGGRPKDRDHATRRSRSET